MYDFRLMFEKTYNGDNLIRVILFEIDRESGESQIRDIIEAPVDTYYRSMRLAKFIYEVLEDACWTETLFHIDEESFVIEKLNAKIIRNRMMKVYRS